jgi:nicotinamidase-related amidase
MNNVVLLVVDVQNALIEAHPHNERKVIENIKKLISAARDNDKEVLYVRHNEEGSEFEKDTEGWQIYDEVVPGDNEIIFEKQYNSAFHKSAIHMSHFQVLYPFHHRDVHTELLFYYFLQLK